MNLKDVDVVANVGYSREREFNFGTQCVCSLYIRLLGSVETASVKKVVIEVHESNMQAAFECSDGILTITQKFNFAAYWKADTYRRKKMILDTIRDSLVSAGRKYRWKYGACNRAYDAALDLKLINARHWGKPIKSPDGKHTARIVTCFEQNGIDVSVEIIDQDTRMARKRALTHLPPHDLFLYDALGTLEWRSNRGLQLTSRAKDKRWAVTL